MSTNNSKWGTQSNPNNNNNNNTNGSRRQQKRTLPVMANTAGVMSAVVEGPHMCAEQVLIPGEHVDRPLKLPGVFPAVRMNSTAGTGSNTRMSSPHRYLRPSMPPRDGTGTTRNGTNCTDRQQTRGDMHFHMSNTADDAAAASIPSVGMGGTTWAQRRAAEQHAIDVADATQLSSRSRPPPSRISRDSSAAHMDSSGDSVHDGDHPRSPPSAGVNTSGDGSNAFLLWQLQLGLKLTRETPLYKLFRLYCVVHDGTQLLMSHADDVWNALVVSSRQQHKISSKSPLERDWRDVATAVGGHPLAWLITIAPPTRDPAADSEHSPRPGGVSFMPGLPSPTAARRKRFQPNVGVLAASAVANNIELDTNTRSQIAHILLNDMRKGSKPGVVALLDFVLTAVTVLPTQPLGMTELRRVFHLLAVALWTQIELMQTALQRMIAELKRAKSKTSDPSCVVTWEEMIGLLQTSVNAKMDNVDSGMGTLPPSHEELGSLASSSSSPHRNRGMPKFTTSSSSCVSSSSLPQQQAVLMLEPTLEQTRCWFKLVQLMHITGVDTLKAEHLLSIVATVLGDVAADVQLTLPQLWKNNNNHHKNNLNDNHDAAATMATARYFRTPSTTPRRDTTPSMGVVPANDDDTSDTADLAVALYALDTLSTRSPGSQAQRDSVFSVQEVTVLLRVVLALISARTAETTFYREQTVRKDVLLDSNYKRTQYNRQLVAQVEELILYLRHTGISQVNVQLLVDIMEEHAPDVCAAIHSQHTTYMSGSTGDPGDTEATLNRMHSISSRSFSAARSASARDGDGDGGGGGVGATSNNYICSDVQRRFNRFIIMAVCHEAVAHRMLLESDLPQPWRKMAAQLHAQSRNGRRPSRAGPNNNNSNKDWAQSLPFPVEESTRSDPYGYHLNEEAHPLLLPTCPPARHVLSWLRELSDRDGGGDGGGSGELANNRPEDSFMGDRVDYSSRGNSDVATAAACNQSCRSLHKLFQRSTTQESLPTAVAVGAPDFLRRIMLSVAAVLAVRAASSAAAMHGLSAAPAAAETVQVMDTFMVRDPHRQLHQAPEFFETL